MTHAAEAMEDLDALRALLDRDDGRDRAYVDARIRMTWARTTDAKQRALWAELHAAVARAALTSHAALRAQIASGSLRGAELRRHFEAVPLLERDHFVEEVLGIAYAPLEEQAPEQDRMAYVPSGYDELVHAFDATGLGASDHFFDVGSGMGKATLLAALLTGATASGIELQAALVELAEGATRQLGLSGVGHQCGDAREAALASADVYFMYLPFSGNVLRAVLGRLVPGRYLCAGALDLRAFPELVTASPAQSWLNVYRWR